MDRRSAYPLGGSVAEGPPSALDAPQGRALALLAVAATAAAATALAGCSTPTDDDTVAGAPGAVGVVRQAVTPTCSTALTPTWPAQWRTMLCHGTPGADPVADVTPAVIDAVGSVDYPAVQSALDADFLYLRLRTNQPVGPSGTCSCTSCVNQYIEDAHGWGFDFDTDGNLATYEFQLLMNGANNASGRTLEFNLNLDQAGAVDNPSEKAETPFCEFTGANTDARVRVDKTTDGSLFGGDCDYFISLAFPLTELQKRGFNMKSARLVWAGSSAQAQNLSGDIVCDNGTRKLTTSSSDPTPLCFNGCCAQSSDCTAGRPTALTSLSAGINAAAATATVGSTAGYPSSGLVVIDSEVIAYTGTAANTFTGLTRGALSTTAAAHSAGATVDDFVGEDVCNTSAGACECSVSPDSCPSGFHCDPLMKKCRKNCSSAAPAGGACSTTGDMTLCCDDGNSCTTNACTAGKCVFTPTNEGLACDDYNNCTSSGVSETARCASGVCGSLVAACTDDGFGCTSDICQSVDLACVHPLKAAGAVCRAATGTCDAAETCSGSSSACPADAYAADDTACDDASLCTSGERCASGVCGNPTSSVSCASPPVCQSTSGATCVPATGQCSYPNSTLGSPCVGGVCNCTTTVCDLTGGGAGVCEAINTCGNGNLEGGEGCDDGDALGGASCTAGCLVPTGVACNTNTAGATGDTSCASTVCDLTGGAPGVCVSAGVCGNSALEGTEGCDDGNTAPGDGCSPACRFENGQACGADDRGLTGPDSCASGVCDRSAGGAGVCEPADTCGNGKVEGLEGCDDGATVSGDGCSPACLVESGGACRPAGGAGASGADSCASGVCDVTAGARGSCEPADVCGNGKLEVNEGCDDGATAAGDGCSVECLVENSRACNASAPGLVGHASCASGICDESGGQPGVCGLFDTDGDGIRDGVDLDDDNDGLLDTAEGGLSTDTDLDGVPDALDLDSDGDGLLDAAEAGHRLGASAGGTVACTAFLENGYCDALETAPESGIADFDGDGAGDGRPADTDGDGIPDFRDLDSDDDGLLDAVESGAACSDAAGDGLCDGDDPDGDGIPASADRLGTVRGSADVLAARDTDADRVPDFRDLDSDDDGLADLVESGLRCADADGDAVCDGGDDDGDGISSAADAAPTARGTTGTTAPRNRDGDAVPDYRDLDSDDDAVSDLIEGASSCTDGDRDGDCDTGDADGDGLVDTADGAPATFGDGAAGSGTPPDRDGDGMADFRDVDSDNDGVFDIVRAGKGGLDADQDGRVDAATDADGDGIRDAADELSGRQGGLGPPRELFVGGGGCGGCATGGGSPGPALVFGAVALAALLRRRRRAPLALAAGLLALGATTAARAQTSAAIDVQLFKPGTGPEDVLTSLSTRTLGCTFCVSGGLWLQYARNPLVLKDASGARAGRLVSEQLAGDIVGTLSLHRALDVGLHLPVQLHALERSTLLDTRYAGAGWRLGAGDLRVIPRFRALGGREGFSLGVAVPVVLPTGRSDAFMGTGAVGFEPRLLVEYATPSLRLIANAGARLRRRAALGNLQTGDEGVWSASGEWRPSSGLPLWVLASAHGLFGFVGGTRAENRSTEVDVGARFGLSSAWSASVAAGRGVVSGYGAPDLRVVAGVSYAHPCCVPTPAPAEEPPPAPVDSDGDGLLDPVDRCPTVPEDKDGFQDDDGCVDADNDGDGVLDPDDKCPTEPETKNGLDDTDGCPDTLPPTDTDGDGLTDDVDRCPTAAEDKDGFADDDGCPDPDNDRDGILDANDKCPTEPETINGNADDDGCPDKGAEKVKLEGDRILILEKVYFATNKDVILKRSFSLLSQVALTLKAHPELRKVRVEGHTDSQGEDAFNLDLSERRAANVKRFLVAAGIDPARLEEAGFGETRPVADNATAKGREQNRRVEFVVLETATVE